MLRIISIFAACVAVFFAIFFWYEILKFIVGFCLILAFANFGAWQMCEHDDRQRAEERAKERQRELQRKEKLEREFQQRIQAEAQMRFAKSKAVPPPLSAEEYRQERLKQERRWYETQGNANVWEKPDKQIGIKDALEIAGLKDLPAPDVLMKLREAALAENPEASSRARAIERAYEVLISVAR